MLSDIYSAGRSLFEEDSADALTVATLLTENNWLTGPTAFMIRGWLHVEVPQISRDMSTPANEGCGRDGREVNTRNYEDCRRRLIPSANKITGRLMPISKDQVTSHSRRSLTKRRAALCESSVCNWAPGESTAADNIELDQKLEFNRVRAWGGA